MSSAMRNASTTVIWASAIFSSRSFGITPARRRSLEILDALQGVLHSAVALERERQRHHATVNAPIERGRLGHDGRGAGAGPAAHAGGHEDHVAPSSASAISCCVNWAAFWPSSGLPPGPQTAPLATAEQNLPERVRACERLGVRVDGDELDAGHALLDLAVDGVAPTPADSNDF